jgi:hypothetical protein
VKALEYNCYDINGYRFQTTKLEASHPLAHITNNGVVTSGEDATGHVTNYYDILQNIVEYTFKIFPINGTGVDDFGMVEVKHKSRYSSSNLLLAHQAQ